MAIISWPASKIAIPTVPCALCHQPTHLTSATAGRRYANGQQAFACNSHSRDLAALIAGWVTFTIHQQYLPEN